MKNIIFIGGIHGSGKGHICNLIIQEKEIQHLTASEVLKWEDFSTQEEKKVNDISKTQDRLITNLRAIVKENHEYLLDGHYCLLNKDNVPEKVPVQTFMDINPSKLILVIADPQIIKERLEQRDSKKYELNLIEEFQNLEVDFAKELRSILNIDLLILDSKEFDKENLLKYLE